MMSRLRGSVSLVGIGLLALGFGCSGASNFESSAACDTDADCASGQSCRRQGSPSGTPQIAMPNLCAMFLPCSTSADCAGDSVCGPYKSTSSGFPNTTCPFSVCQARCQEGSCPVDQICGDDGLCAFQPCDEDGAPACAEHFRCDTASAKMIEQRPLAGSSVTPNVDMTRERTRGCVPKECDETDGFSCREFWTCAPETSNDASGCTANACADTGHCSDDSYSVCEPTSDGRRPVGTDVHGCVIRNCEEGRECTFYVDSINVAYCDAHALDADALGCVLRPCESDTECAMGYMCDPGDAQSDGRGCRLDSSMSGGTGGGAGSGGVGGSGGSGAGGSGAVGSTGGSGATGGTASVGGTGGGGGSGAVSGGGGSAGTGGSASGAAGSAGGPGRCVDG